MNSYDLIKSASNEETDSIEHVFITPKKPKTHCFYQEKNSQSCQNVYNVNENVIFLSNNQKNESTIKKKYDHSFIFPCLKTPVALNTSFNQAFDITIFSSPFNNFLSQSPLSFETI